MIRLITVAVISVLSWPSVCSAEPNIYGDCGLKKLHELDDWEWVKKDARFEFAELCNYSDVEGMPAITLYGPVKKRDGIVYREQFSGAREGDVYKFGYAFPSFEGDSTDVNLSHDDFFVIQSASNFDVILNVYENGILYLRECMSSDQCVENLLESYGFWGRMLDDEYREFRKRLLDRRNRQNLINDVSVFHYDADMHRLSFEIELPIKKHWYIELDLSPPGEVNKLRRVSLSII